MPMALTLTVLTFGDFALVRRNVTLLGQLRVRMPGALAAVMSARSDAKPDRLRWL